MDGVKKTKVESLYEHDTEGAEHPTYMYVDSDDFLQASTHTPHSPAPRGGRGAPAPSAHTWWRRRYCFESFRMVVSVSS